MPPSTSPKTTGDRILEIAREILAADGVGALSFDAIARRLGRTKQAVLYWYPTKQELLAAMFLPWLEAEAEAACQAVAGAAGRNAAIAGFVRAVAGFHLADLDRFRMMYLVPQTLPPAAQDADRAALLDRVHPLSDRVYGALAAHLGGAAVAARREAVAIHSAVLGLVLLHGLSDSLRDPLKHAAPDLVEALVASLQAR